MLGSLVKVRPGYARNFLLPFGKALPATKENIADFEARRCDLEQQASDKLTAAKGRATALSEIELTLTAKAGDEGKLFGSIGVRDLTEAITSSGVKILKSEIRMPNGPIRHVGEYDVSVHLHLEVITTIKVFVKAE